MEKPDFNHQEYRDNLAKDLKEIRNNQSINNILGEGSSRELASDILNKTKETAEYKDSLEIKKEERSLKSLEKEQDKELESRKHLLELKKNGDEYKIMNLQEIKTALEENLRKNMKRDRVLNSFNFKVYEDKIFLLANYSVFREGQSPSSTLYMGTAYLSILDGEFKELYAIGDTEYSRVLKSDYSSWTPQIQHDGTPAEDFWISKGDNSEIEISLKRSDNKLISTHSFNEGDVSTKFVHVILE